MSEQIESTVTSDAGSVAAESTAIPEPSSSSAAAPDSAASSAAPASSPTGRTYSDAQVQEIIRARLAQANKSWEKRSAEYDRKLKEYESVVHRANAGIEGLARGFGFIQEPEKKPWEADIQATRKELSEQYEAQIRAIEERRMYAAIVSDFDRVKAAYPKYAGLPGFKDEFSRVWKPGQDPVAAVKAIVSEYEKVFAASSNAAAEEKEKALKSAPVGKGGGSSSASKDEGGPLRKRLQGALRASRS